MKYTWVFVLLLFLSCDNEVVFTPNSSFNLTTGINITDETSPETIFEFGNPREKKIVSIGNDQQIEIFTPYPNPADGAFRLELRTPKPAQAKIWVETAYLSANGLTSVEEERIFERLELFDSDLEIAGSYSFSLDIKTKCLEGNLEQGFFRVFVLVDNTYLLYTDIYITGYSNLTPPGLVSTAPTIHPCDYLNN